MADTVLLVDDTPANLGILVQCLTDVGHRVLVAEDGEEALELLAQSRPDLVLLDVMMPGIDGFETCRRLRALPQHRDLPVIFMTALNDTREKLTGFASGAVDYITKPIQHEEALARVAAHLQIRRLQQQLAAELALREKFMRIASHDLRNPLCLIMMAAAVGKRKAHEPQSVQLAMGEIDSAARHMRGLIDTFLQLRAGDRTARFDLPALVEAVSKRQTPAAEAKDQRLTFQAQPGLPAARGDSAEVFQIATNLLSNAVKFTPRGGAIDVAVSRSASGRGLRLAVADTGPGVPPGERAQLFTEFARLTPQPTNGEESHGLGLSIVRQLAEQNGGRVGADFPPGGGSVFWCELDAFSP